MPPTLHACSQVIVCLCCGIMGAFQRHRRHRFLFRMSYRDLVVPCCQSLKPYTCATSIQQHVCGHASNVYGITLQFTSSWVFCTSCVEGILTGAILVVGCPTSSVVLSTLGNDANFGFTRGFRPASFGQVIPACYDTIMHMPAFALLWSVA